MIKLLNISKTFNMRLPSRNEVLKNVSFELPNKGLIAIFGKSGSGKTTLLNILGGLDKPDKGLIVFDDVETKVVSDKIRNKNIGFIFQNYYLEKNTKITDILKNQMMIAGFTDLKEAERRTEIVLDLVKLSRFKNKTGDALSGGQKQRVAIARALIKGADIILADEPTGNLDSENTEIVMEILKEISKTKLVVLVTHEQNLIEKFSDGYIHLVDGEVKQVNLENSLTVKVEKSFDFEKSTSKISGKLFNFNSVIKHIKSGQEEKFYSTANIFKQIFILCFSLILCFFGMKIFEVTNLTYQKKEITSDSTFLKLDSYQEIRKFSPTIYNEIDFFEMDYKMGIFSFKNVGSMSIAEEKYEPQFLKDDYKLLIGKSPLNGEVVITKKLAENIIKNLRINSINHLEAVLMMTFNNRFQISGVIESDVPRIYFNKDDYVNFLGIYKNLSFQDQGELFFSGNTNFDLISTSISLTQDALTEEEVIVEVNRNSLYKFFKDVSQADFRCENTNLNLYESPKQIQIKNSKLFVKKFKIVRTKMDTDLKVFVSKKVLDNIFVYLSPNIDRFKEKDVFFMIKADNKKQSLLKERLKLRSLNEIDVFDLYNENYKTIKKTFLKSVNILLIIVGMLTLIFYFIEKSESIKESKDYGVYRAIGVNKTNLLYKEFITSLMNDFISYTIFFIIGISFIVAMYVINNVNFVNFILITLGIYGGFLIILMFISLIPYLFVVRNMPAKILARYDI